MREVLAAILWPLIQEVGQLMAVALQSSQLWLHEFQTAHSLVTGVINTKQNLNNPNTASRCDRDLPYICALGAWIGHWLWTKYLVIFTNLFTDIFLPSPSLRPLAVHILLVLVPPHHVPCWITASVKCAYLCLLYRDYPLNSICSFLFSPILSVGSITQRLQKSK